MMAIERVEVADVEALPRDVGEVLDEPRSGAFS